MKKIKFNVEALRMYGIVFVIVMSSVIFILIGYLMWQNDEKQKNIEIIAVDSADSNNTVDSFNSAVPVVPVGITEIEAETEKIEKNGKKKADTPQVRQPTEEEAEKYPLLTNLPALYITTEYKMSKITKKNIYLRDILLYMKTVREYLTNL